MLFLLLLVQRKVTLLTGKNTARYVQNIFKLKKLHFLTSMFCKLGLPWTSHACNIFHNYFFSVLSSFDILLCFVQGIKFFEPEVTN